MRKKKKSRNRCELEKKRKKEKKKNDGNEDRLRTNWGTHKKGKKKRKELLHGTFWHIKEVKHDTNKKLRKKYRETVVERETEKNVGTKNRFLNNITK